jgi:hypothetical protein
VPSLQGRDYREGASILDKRRTLCVSGVLFSPLAQGSAVVLDCSLPLERCLVRLLWAAPAESMPQEAVPAPYHRWFRCLRVLPGYISPGMNQRPSLLPVTKQVFWDPWFRKGDARSFGSGSSRMDYGAVLSAFWSDVRSNVEAVSHEASVNRLRGCGCDTFGNGAGPFRVSSWSREQSRKTPGSTISSSFLCVQGP